MKLLYADIKTVIQKTPILIGLASNKIQQEFIELSCYKQWFSLHFKKFILTGNELYMRLLYSIFLHKTALVAYKCRWPRASIWLSGVRRGVVLDAAEFLTSEGLMSPKQTVKELARNWPELAQNLWNRTTPETFYKSWDGEAGASNLAANVVDQLSRPYVAAALMRHLEGFQGYALDYGCGTATLALAWKRDFAPDAHLYLADIDNLSKRFLEWRMGRKPVRHVELVSIDLQGIPDAGLDVIICLDVLEHLSQPSEVFLSFDRKLKRGGLLFIQAPWGGSFEHLKEAPVNWEKNGGAQRLAKAYCQQARMKPWGALSGVYLKTE